MPSPACEEAMAGSARAPKETRSSRLRLPYDVGLTGGHQSGYCLPISAWEVFTP